MSETGTFCVICSREAHHGYLCDDDFAELAAMLRQIEDEAAILDARPSMAIRSGAGGGGTLASHRAPANLDVIVATDSRRGLMRWSSDDFDEWGLDDTASILDTLHSRARTVREEGPFDGPETITISGERDFLTRRLDWCARQPWIDEMYEEMRDLLKQLQRSNKTKPAGPEGFCYLPRNESTCGGRIWRREHERFVWAQAAPGSDRCDRQKVKVSDGEAYCERCRATWDGKALVRLRLALEQEQAEAARPRTDDGRLMLTAEEMAAKLRMTVGNLRTWASRRGIRAVQGHYDEEWFAEKMAG
ncbi:MAG: hypothetical protein ACXVXO_12505 [Mycobacteriaceae bacterium]